MRKTRTTRIADQDWVLVQHPATEGLVVLRNMSTLIGQAIGALSKSDGGAKGLLDLDIGLEAIGRIAEELLSKLTDEKVAWLVKLILKYVQDKDGPLFPPPDGSGKVQPDRFDEVFSGNYLALAKVVSWVLKENFSEVFQSTGIAGLFRGSMPAEKKSDGLRD